MTSYYLLLDRRGILSNVRNDSNLTYYFSNVGIFSSELGKQVMSRYDFPEARRAILSNVRTELTRPN